MDSSLIMNFMLSDDGSTLLAVRQGSNGYLELISTPVTILQNRIENSLSLSKALNPNLALNQLQLNLHSNNTQQPNVTSIEVINLEPPSIQNTAPGPTKPTSNSIQNKTKLQQQNSQGTSLKVQNPEGLTLVNKNKTSTKPQEVEKEVSGNLEKSSACPKKYARKSLGRPKKNSQTSEEQACFKCDVCGQEFKKQYLLQKHVHEHAQEKPHHCPKCPASFNAPTNFTLHMATHTIGEPKCPECGRRFARMASLKSHMLIHEVDESLYCTECDDSFGTKAQLDAHLKLHSEKPSTDDYRKCKLCRKQFTLPVLYRQHLRDHYKLQTKFTKQTKRGIRYRTTYKCSICLKTFEKPSQLSRHIRVHTGEKPFKCNLCNRSFTQKSSLRIHTWQHNGVRPYSCSFCPAKCSQKANLNAHILRVHNVQEDTCRSPVYRCSQCPCIFKKLGSLNGHIKRAHSGQSREENSDKEEELSNNANSTAKTTVESPEADTTEAETTTGKNTTEAEITTEAAAKLKDGFVVTDDSDQTAVVTVLDKALNDKGKYVKIRQRFVNNFRFYECSFCDKKFKKPSDVMRHLRIHTREKPFKCKTCNRSFTLKSTLLSHEKIHINFLKFSCEICKTRFSTESALQAHENVHKKGHKCALCDKKFENFEELKDHSAIHNQRKPKSSRYGAEVQKLAPEVILKEPLVLTEASNGLLHAQPKFRNELAQGKGRPHKCPVCPAAFMKLSHMKQHHRKHTGERPYACTLCDRKFTSNSTLKAHLRIHDLLKPYKCSICHANFSTLSSMKRHSITHSNKRPFMCPYCNKTFKTTVNCRKHMQIHKEEIASQQLEQQKKQITNTANIESSSLKNKTVVIADPVVVTTPQLAFQPGTDNFTQKLNEGQESNNFYKNKEAISISSLHSNMNLTTQNDAAINHSNVPVIQTLHVDETGAVTLPYNGGNQILTHESIREMEETLNQQLLSIGMNLGINNMKQINQNNTLSDFHDQSILSIIYDNGKTLEAPINIASNANVFSTQFDTFDINQIALQGDNEIDIGMTQVNSTNLASILPNTIPDHQSFNRPLISNNFEVNSVLNQEQSSNNKQGDNDPQSIKFKEIIVDKDTINLSQETNLQCHMCNKQGFDTNGLSEHLKQHQSDREYECMHCLAKFCTSGGLSRHVKTHESEQESHKCYECNKEFSTTLLLREHIKDHVKHELELQNLVEFDDINKSKSTDDDTDKKAKCLYCPKTFRKPSDLVRHVRTHTGERPYQCQFCSKSFAVKCTLDSHLKIHGGGKSFHCFVCDSFFATKGSLKVHMRLHTGSKPFKCLICDMRFRTSGHRSVHMATHTRNKNTPKLKKASSVPSSVNSEKPEDAQDDRIVQIIQTVPASQDILTQPLLDNQNLNTITINPDQITFNADGSVISDQSGLLSASENNQLVANLQFLLANGLVTIQTDESLTNLSPNNGVENQFIEMSDVQKMQEQASETQVIFTSDVSSNITDVTDVNNYQLNNCMVLQLGNIESPEPEKPEETTKPVKVPNMATRRECDICGKAFAKPCQVMRHKRIHTGERPFQCEICNKSFAQKSTLQMHQKRHTGDRPYSCPECDRAFTQSCNLQTHLKRKHKINPADAKRLPKTQQFVHYDPKTLQQSVEDARVLSFDDISIVELLN